MNEAFGLYLMALKNYEEALGVIMALRIFIPYILMIEIIYQ